MPEEVSHSGVLEIALGLAREDLASVFSQKERQTYEQLLHLFEGRKQGTLRVSVRLPTNFADVYHLLQFAQTYINRSALSPLTEQSSLSPASQTDCVAVVIAARRSGSVLVVDNPAVRGDLHEKVACTL